VLADGAWQIGVLLAALTALAMARKKDAKDEWFHALLACVAAVMFAAEVFPERSGMAMAVAAIAWIQVAAVLTLQGGDRSTKVFAAFAMLGWLILLATDPEVGTHPWRGWLHAAMLSIFVVLSAVGLRIRVKAPSSPASSSSSSFLLGNLSSARSTLTVAVALVPALIAFKLDASTVMVMSLASLGLSAVVVAEGRGRVGSMLDALWGWHDRAAVHGRLSGPAALLGVLGAVLTAELAGEAVSISAPAHLMSGLGGAASLLIWVIHGQHDQHGLSPERDIRSTLAGAAGIVVGYLWVISVDFGSTIRIDRDASWSAVRDSALLPFLVTGFGVWRLFLSSRSERRQAWQVSAVLCASATVCLLLKMGSALLSPIGAAASLLGTGVLLLLAGYIAPQPQDTTSETPPQ
jgi:hypothetical protein